MKKANVVKAWGGFVADKLDWTEMDTGWGGFGVGLEMVPSVFRTRKSARAKYHDVRRVEIREVRK